MERGSTSRRVFSSLALSLLAIGCGGRDEADGWRAVGTVLETSGGLDQDSVPGATETGSADTGSCCACEEEEEADVPCTQVWDPEGGDGSGSDGGSDTGVDTSDAPGGTSTSGSASEGDDGWDPLPDLPPGTTAVMAPPDVLLEFIYVSDTEIITRMDGATVRHTIPKGEIVKGVIEDHANTVHKAIGHAAKESLGRARALKSGITIVWRGLAPMGFFALLETAALAGPAFAETVLPDTCAALKDPNRGDACKEVIQWVARASNCAAESCADCFAQTLGKFPQKSAETCRAGENAATFDAKIQEKLMAKVHTCGGRKGGYATKPPVVEPTISGVTPPELGTVCSK